MKNKIPDNIKISSPDIDPDENYKNQIKQHRNTIEKLNHYFRICSHPFILTIILIFLGILFCAFYILAKATSIEWITSFKELLGKILSYVATVVFSSLFTWFIENHDKLKNKQKKDE